MNEITRVLPVGSKYWSLYIFCWKFEPYIEEIRSVLPVSILYLDKYSVVTLHIQ